MAAAKRYDDIPAPSDLLERIVAEIDARLEELHPAVEEQENLMRAAEALGLGIAARPSVSAFAPSFTPPWAHASARVSASAPRRGRPPAASRPAQASDGRTAETPSDPIAPAAMPVPALPPMPALPPTPAPPPSRQVAQRSILDALEHGSHTLSELVVVTAMSAGTIRSHVRPLLNRRVVARTRREGKSAYALVKPPA